MCRRYFLFSLKPRSQGGYPPFGSLFIDISTQCKGRSEKSRCRYMESPRFYRYILRVQWCHLLGADSTPPLPCDGACEPSAAAYSAALLLRAAAVSLVLLTPLEKYRKEGACEGSTRTKSTSKSSMNCSFCRRRLPDAKRRYSSNTYSRCRRMNTAQHSIAQHTTMR